MKLKEQLDYQLGGLGFRAPRTRGKIYRIQKK